VLSAAYAIVRDYMRSQERDQARGAESIYDNAQIEVMNSITSLVAGLAGQPGLASIKKLPVANSQMCLTPLINSMRQLVDAFDGTVTAEDDGLPHLQWSTVMSVMKHHDNPLQELPITLIVSAADNDIKLRHKIAVGEGAWINSRSYRLSDSNPFVEANPRLYQEGREALATALNNPENESKLQSFSQKIYQRAANADGDDAAGHIDNLRAGRRIAAFPYMTELLIHAYVQYHVVLDKSGDGGKSANEAWTNLVQMVEHIWLFEEAKGADNPVDTRRIIEEYVSGILQSESQADLKSDVAALENLEKEDRPDIETIPRIAQAADRVRQFNDAQITAVNELTGANISSKFTKRQRSKSGKMYEVVSETSAKERGVNLPTNKVLAQIRASLDVLVPAKVNGRELKDYYNVAGVAQADLTVQLLAVIFFQAQMAKEPQGKVSAEEFIGQCKGLAQAGVDTSALYTVRAGEITADGQEVLVSEFERVRGFEIGSRKVSVSDWDRAFPPKGRGATGSRTNPSVTQSAGPDYSKLRDQLQALFKSTAIDDGRYASLMLSHDIPFFLGVVGFRNGQQYLMGSAILMKSGGHVGYTYHNKGRFIMGLDHKTDHIHGQYDIYFKSVVTGPQFMVRVPDVFCAKSLGGNGTDMYDNCNAHEINTYRSGEPHKDMLLTPRWANFRQTAIAIDITGKYHPSLRVSDSEVAQCWYDGCLALCSKWGIRHNPDSPLDTSWATQVRRTAIGSRMNTLCFPAVQWNYNHKPGGGTWDIVSKEKGHWGAHVGPGSRAARNGDAMVVPPQAYVNAAVAA
jgi:hypothetical protein